MTVNKKKKVIIAAVICAVVIIGVAIFCGFNNHYENGSQPQTGAIVLDANAEEWDSPTQPSNTAPGIQIPGYGDLYIPANTKDVNITLSNPKGNNCYFEFKLYIDDEDKPIYTTNYVEPGKAVKKLTLSKPLSEGEYTLKININTFDLKTKQPLNNAQVKAKLFAVKSN